MNISIIPQGHIHEVLPALVVYAQKASGWTLGRLSTDDILASMFRSEVTTWLLFDDDKIIHGYLTTQIIDYPRSRNFCVLNCGGDDGMLDVCVDLVFDTFERYASDSGCDGLEIIGRPAWWKHIKERGYQQPQRQYFKNLRS